jgi:hypothetical protein
MSGFGASRASINATISSTDHSLFSPLGPLGTGDLLHTNHEIVVFDEWIMLWMVAKEGVALGLRVRLI